MVLLGLIVPLPEAFRLLHLGFGIVVEPCIRLSDYLHESLASLRG